MAGVVYDLDELVELAGPRGAPFSRVELGRAGAITGVALPTGVGPGQLMGVALPTGVGPGQLISPNRARQLAAQLLLAADLHDAIYDAGAKAERDALGLTEASAGGIGGEG